MLPASTIGLTQLGYAVAVDTHRHFARAAQACGVTQPTLSMQLAKLERTLGLILFDRTVTPVVPTDVGRLVIEQARVALREVARLGDIAAAQAGVVTGELRLGIIPTLAPHLLPRLIPALARRHPDLELVIEERITDDIGRALRRDALDAGIVATSLSDRGIVERFLFNEPFVGYVAANHRLARQRTIAVRDLSLDDLWLLEEGHCFRAQAVQLCSQRVARTARNPAASTTGARFESGNLETLRRLVERGTGMTLLPLLAARELRSPAERRHVRPFSAPVPSRDVRLVLRRTYLKGHLIDALVDCLLETLPEELRRTRPVSSE